MTDEFQPNHKKADSFSPMQYSPLWNGHLRRLHITQSIGTTSTLTSQKEIPRIIPSRTLKTVADKTPKKRYATMDTSRITKKRRVSCLHTIVIDPKPLTPDKEDGVGGNASQESTQKKTRPQPAADIKPFGPPSVTRLKSSHMGVHLKPNPPVHKDSNQSLVRKIGIILSKETPSTVITKPVPLAMKSSGVFGDSKASIVHQPGTAERLPSCSSTPKGRVNNIIKPVAFPAESAVSPICSKLSHKSQLAIAGNGSSPATGKAALCTNEINDIESSIDSFGSFYNGDWLILDEVCEADVNNISEETPTQQAIGDVTTSPTVAGDYVTGNLEEIHALSEVSTPMQLKLKDAVRGASPLMEASLSDNLTDSGPHPEDTPSPQETLVIPESPSLCSSSSGTLIFSDSGEALSDRDISGTRDAPPNAISVTETNQDAAVLRRRGLTSPAVVIDIPTILIASDTAIITATSSVSSSAQAAMIPKLDTVHANDVITDMDVTETGMTTWTDSCDAGSPATVSQPLAPHVSNVSSESTDCNLHDPGFHLGHPQMSTHSTADEPYSPGSFHNMASTLFTPADHAGSRDISMQSLCEPECPQLNNSSDILASGSNDSTANALCSLRKPVSLLVSSPSSPVSSSISPVYSPSSPVSSSISPVYSPSSQVSSLINPVYSPSSPVSSSISAVYSPSSPVSSSINPMNFPSSPDSSAINLMYSPISPVYSPSASPVYSPSSPGSPSISPVYSPSSPVRTHVSPFSSPADLVSSPACLMSPLTSPMSSMETSIVPNPIQEHSSGDQLDLVANNTSVCTEVDGREAFEGISVSHAILQEEEDRQVVHSELAKNNIDESFSKKLSVSPYVLPELEETTMADDGLGLGELVGANEASPATPGAQQGQEYASVRTLSHWDIYDSPPVNISDEDSDDDLPHYEVVLGSAQLRSKFSQSMSEKSDVKPVNNAICRQSMTPDVTYTESHVHHGDSSAVVTGSHGDSCAVVTGSHGDSCAMVTGSHGDSSVMDAGGERDKSCVMATDDHDDSCAVVLSDEEDSEQLPILFNPRASQVHTDIKDVDSGHTKSFREDDFVTHRAGNNDYIKPRVMKQDDDIRLRATQRAGDDDDEDIRSSVMQRSNDDDNDNNMLRLKSMLDTLLIEKTNKLEDDARYAAQVKELNEGLRQGGFNKLTRQQMPEVAESLLLPRHKNELAKFEVQEQHIVHHAPGECIFDQQQARSLFTFPTTLTLAVCGFIPGRGVLDRMLTTVDQEGTLELLNSSVVLLYFESISCPDAFLDWIFMILSEHPNDLLADACLNLLLDILEKDSGKGSDWAPTTLILSRILVNYGASLSDLICHTELLDFTDSDLSLTNNKENSRPDNESQHQRRPLPDLLLPGGQYPFHNNLCSVLRVLTGALHCRPEKYCLRDLQALTIILLRLSIEHQLDNHAVKHNVKICLSTLLKAVPANKWNNFVSAICEVAPKLTDHHHNMRELVEVLPAGDRGMELQRHLAYIFLCLLRFGQPQTFSKDLQVRQLVPVIQSLKIGPDSDYYLLASLVMLLDRCVGNGSLPSNEKDDLRMLCDLLNSCMGSVRENIRDLDRSVLKDMMVQVSSKWTFMLESMGSRQSSIFQFTKPCPQLFIEQIPPDAASLSDLESDPTEQV